MTDYRDINAHIHCGEPRPAGAAVAIIKAPFVATTHTHSRKRLHRPAFAVTAIVDGQYRLAARFLCGGASNSVVALRESIPGLEPCAKCDRSAGALVREWAVYAYYDTSGTALYVGQTCDLESRHKAHASDRRSSAWFRDQVWRAVLSRHDNQLDAMRAERESIRELRPRFNVVHNRWRAS